MDKSHRHQASANSQRLGADEEQKKHDFLHLPDASPPDQNPSRNQTTISGRTNRKRRFLENCQQVERNPSHRTKNDEEDLVEIPS